MSADENDLILSDNPTPYQYHMAQIELDMRMKQEIGDAKSDIDRMTQFDMSRKMDEDYIGIIKKANELIDEYDEKMSEYPRGEFNTTNTSLIKTKVGTYYTTKISKMLRFIPPIHRSELYKDAMRKLAVIEKQLIRNTVNKVKTGDRFKPYGGGSKQKRRKKSRKSRRNTLKKKPRKTFRKTLKKRSKRSKRSTKRH